MTNFTVNSDGSYKVFCDEMLNQWNEKDKQHKWQRKASLYWAKRALKAEQKAKDLKKKLEEEEHFFLELIEETAGGKRKREAKEWARTHLRKRRREVFPEVIGNLVRAHPTKIIREIRIRTRGPSLDS